MATLSFADKTVGGLSFTNITATSTSVGVATAFTASTPNFTGRNSSTLPGIEFNAFQAGAYGPGSSQTILINYNVSVTDLTKAITTLQEVLVADALVGIGASVTAVEQVYDADTGALLASVNWSASGGSKAIRLMQGAQNLRVQLTIQETIAPGAPANSVVDISDIQQNFALTPVSKLGSIGDIVFLDTDGSGVESGFDGGPGVPGMTVQLLNAAGTSVIATTTTDMNGLYSFNFLAAGTYRVRFIPLDGYALTVQNASSDPGVSSSPDPATGLTAVITLAAGQAIHTVEAGIVPAQSSSAAQTASIGDFVWFDNNHNGVFDSGSETGLANVTVQLLDDATQTVLATTVTDNSGSYLFSQLAAGTYDVRFIAPNGDLFTTQVTGNGSNTVSTPNATGLTALITLASGQAITTIDAGLYQTASLGDYVWLDANANGVQDAGEAGIAAVTVDLMNAAGTTVLAVTTTDATGHYLFGNLTPGSYAVKFIAPTGNVFTAQTAGSNSALDSNANATTGITAAVTLASGQSDTTIDAGLYQAASLGDYVWLDANANGVQDAGEAGIAGVTVDLMNAAGTTVLAVTTTDATGHYLFGNLTPGSYAVKFIAPTGNVFTAQTAGSNTALDSNANTTTGLTAAVTLASGQSDTTIDAGLYQTASLGDYVWLDANANGVQDAGEAGIAGVTVDLMNAAGTTVLAVTTTDATGHYLFGNLTPGSYAVKFIAPTGNVFTAQTAGSNTALDSNANTTTGLTAAVTLASGQSDTTIDAGLYQTASLGDYVWLDANANGVQDAGEAGIAGVTVDLMNAAGTTVLAVTTTDATGHYLFGNLTPGSYAVKFIAPTGKVFTAQTAGSNSALDSNANATTGITAAVTLASGQSDTTIDAGLYQTASLGDYVWLDANANGVQDAGEAGIAGVTVDLMNAAGTTVLAVTTTDTTGHYLFGNLTPGSYAVKFIAPTGNVFTAQTVGSNTALDSNANTTTGLTAAVTLASGQSDTTIDAGLYQTASLGDYVWLDANANGVQDAGEAGIAGVTVDLMNAAGTTVLAVTTTDATGHYLFGNLTPGSYAVKFIAPTGNVFTAQTAGSNTALDSNANTTTGLTAAVTLASGQSDTTIDAGLYQTASLGDYVWLDANANGVQDAGEAGIAGVTVDLMNAAGTTVLAVTTTDATGHYLFGNLTPGSYAVKFIAPTGKVFTAQTVGSNTSLDSNANTTTGLTAAVTLTSGQSNTSVDAGLIPPALISVIKLPNKAVITKDGQVTYTINVSNTGTAGINNVVVKDNIGTATAPNYITPSAVVASGYNVGDTNHNNMLDAGETWQYSATITPTASTLPAAPAGSSGTVTLMGQSSGAPLTTAQFNALNGTGATYGPAAAATFLDKPYTVNSTLAAQLTTGPSASKANGIVLVLSATSGSIAALGTQTIQLLFNGQLTNFTAADFASNTAENFPASTGGMGNGQVNSISFASSMHAGADFRYGSALNAAGATGASLGTVVVNSPINLRVDVFGEQNGLIVDNAANSGSEGVTGVAGTGGAPRSQGVADTVTATGTATTGATVTAQDTKEVQVLAATSNITVDKLAPTGSLSSQYGAAGVLEFTYNPGNTVSVHTTSIGAAGGSNANTMAFLEITNNANPFASNATMYFKGQVTAGEKIFADATTNELTNTVIAAPNNHFSTTAGAALFGFLFNSASDMAAGTAPIQTMSYNASGSQAMYLGDTIGSLKVVGYVGTTGGYLTA